MMLFSQFFSDTYAKSPQKTEIWRNYRRYLRQISKKK